MTSHEKPRKLLDDCFLHDKDRLRHEEALSILTERLRPVVGTEGVPLAEASGRILAETVTAPRNIPAHTNAAVDGYAFAHGGYDREEGTRFRLGGRAAAGHALASAIGPGEAARIFTGAVMPEGTDTVAMQEDVQLEDGSVFIPGGLKAGANRRLAGEDVRAGATLIEAGARLTPQDIAALAATGAGEVTCYRPLRVAVISTGDELLAPGAPFSEGRVYDANAPMLMALSGLTGHPAHFLGVLPDKAALVRDKLAEAAENFDLVISSGGASRGEEDHIVKAIDALGSLRMWQLAIKPGRPMSFGQIGDNVFLGLPGNPVAVFVCFLLYANPVMTLLGGGKWRAPLRYPVPAGFALTRRKTGRREFLRGMLAGGGGVQLSVKPYPQDGSGLISSLRASQGLIEIAEEVAAIDEGQPVSFIPYSEFGIHN
jgi:molybdopterin molybdotransferase